jgi:hypothetical protein
MASEARADVHHNAPRWLLGLFDAAAGGFADWSEFDVEAERWGIDVRGLWCEGLRALIEGSTREIPATEHRRLHQEASDFVRWGRGGGFRACLAKVRVRIVSYAIPRTHSLCEVLDAIFYVVKSGCHWRLLPHDLPP